MTATNSVVITANDLRALAEASDSLRDVDSCIVLNPKGESPAYIVVTRDDAMLRGLTPIIELHTDDDPRVPSRPSLQLRTDQALVFRENHAHDINECDAIFTSLSAVEKFVAPYYAKIQGLRKAEEMRMRFAGDSTVVAMVHLPASIEDEGAIGASGHIFAAVQQHEGAEGLQLLSLEDFLAR